MPRTITLSTETMSLRHFPQHSQLRGAGLIEIMVAVALFSIGLIGILRLQIASIAKSESAYIHTQAALASYALFDTLRADRVGAIAGRYNMAKNCTTTSTASGLARNVHEDWLRSVKATLGSHGTTCGEVECVGTLCTVRIYWDDSRVNDGPTEAIVEIATQL